MFYFKSMFKVLIKLLLATLFLCLTCWGEGMRCDMRYFTSVIFRLNLHVRFFAETRNSSEPPTPTPPPPPRIGRDSLLLLRQNANRRGAQKFQKVGVTLPASVTCDNCRISLVSVTIIQIMLNKAGYTTNRRRYRWRWAGAV